MVENLDSGTRARRTLQATALMMMLSTVLIGARGREATPHPGGMAGSTGAPLPAPAAFLAASSRGGGSGGAHGAQGAPGAHGVRGANGPDDVTVRDTAERIAALSKVLSRGDRAAAAPVGSEGPVPSREPGASAASAVAPVETRSPESNPAGRAEVVARLERGGAVYWLLSVRPEGRLLRAGVSSGPGSGPEPQPGEAPPPEPYLRRIDGRFELVTDRGRYRLVEPPWEASRTAVVGESP